MHPSKPPEGAVSEEEDISKTNLSWYSELTSWMHEVKLILCDMSIDRYNFLLSSKLYPYKYINIYQKCSALIKVSVTLSLS